LLDRILLPFAVAAALLALPGAARARAEPAPPGEPDAPPGPPPWSAEAPGGAGAPLGLGLDGLAERQRSLTIDSARTTVTTRDDAHGTTLTQVLDGDPTLLNRKFSIRYKTTSFGAQLPIALPRLLLGKGLGITPTFVLQAVENDVELDFVDLPEPAASTSLHGRALQLSAALDLVGPLCRRCGWYAGAGYRYRFTPRFSVERGQPVQEPGARIAASDVRLGRTVGEASLRLGRVFGRDRAALYVGVQRRRVRTTVDDDLLIVQDVIQQQTRLASRTRFASTRTAALAGLDVHVAGPLFVRAEVTFGKGDSNVLGKLVIVPPLRPWLPELQLRNPERQRATRIADAIAPGLAAIRERFAKESRRLLAQPAPSAAEVGRLLDDTERGLRSVLSARELTALRDSVADLFARARDALHLPSPTRIALRSGADDLIVFAAARTTTPLGLGPRRAATLQARQTTLDPNVTRTWLQQIGDYLDLLFNDSVNHNLLVNLTIRSKPKAKFSMHPVSDPIGPDPVWTDGSMLNVYRGRYLYTVEAYEKERYQQISEEPKNSFDFVTSSQPILCCLEVKGSATTPHCKRFSEREKKEPECP
jgi:hypothetical protein